MPEDSNVMSAKKRRATLDKSSPTSKMNKSSARDGSTSVSPSSDASGSTANIAHVKTSPGEEDSTLNRSSSLTREKSVTKRIKTVRACDSCRRKKIRCDVIDDGGPILGDPNNGNGGLTCAHCRQYGFECTFFLPIAETRFKKKRDREAEELAAAAANQLQGFPASQTQTQATMHPFQVSNFPQTPIAFHGHHLPPHAKIIGINTRANLNSAPVRISSTQEWPRPKQRSPSPLSRANTSSRTDIGSSSDSSLSRSGRANLPAYDQPPPPGDTRVLGPTSIAYIIHSTAFVPGAAIEEHDLKYNQTFEVGASGNGIIKFHKPPKGAVANAEDADDTEVLFTPEVIRGRLAGDVAEKLVNSYFEKIGYLFPVVTKSEFLHMSSPPPLMLYAICGIAALSREVPKEVLSSIKITLNGLFRDMDLLSNSNNETVKSLLIMSLHSDVHGSTAVQSGTRCWNRVGAAIRMSQDLGLHRDASGRDDLDDDAFYLEQKRRIWGCCVTADRCSSISLGHPLAIDLTDCDVRLPSPHEILRFATDLPSNPNEEKPFAFNTEMLKLSILFGRVMKTIYSPTGLMKTTDEEIVSLLSDIDRWKEHLPDSLQFNGPQHTSSAGGILHVSFACLLHLFFRVFMRISYNCPQHLSFSLTIERMTNLIKYSREAIEWVDCNEFYLDTMQFVSYGMVFCATVQYHAWIRRGDHNALSTLKLARDSVMRYHRQGENSGHDELTMRSKTAEVIKLLHESAIGAYANSPNSGNLNPTAGVSNRRTADTVRGIIFKPDQTRPGGGVYVATKSNLMLDDLPEGTIVLQETESGHVPTIVRTENSDGISWRAIDQNNETTSGTSSHAMMNTGSKQDSEPQTNLTHIAGGVWIDAEGRPVDRRGSRLVTMIPVQNSDTVPGQYEAIGEANHNRPRLSFSAIADGLFGPNGVSQNENGVTSQAASASVQLNDSAWLSAMAAQGSAGQPGNMDGESGSLPPSLGFSDMLHFDGQVSGSVHRNTSTTRRSVSADAPPRSVEANIGTPSVGTTFPFGSSSTTNNGVLISSVHNQPTDLLSLDGMPGGALDFVAWDQWFRGSSSLNSGGL